ncbi:hypothetical protein E2C01_017676 [Portunus trituberculatus]|uniref:Uncharacterized protein n=1 Tax=Portunus trituberculatus TaxID=210409 RepID=A0A5B7DT39_PORTR|nr:hypothetical protein [Portunus trituberculatus]
MDMTFGDMTLASLHPALSFLPVPPIPPPPGRHDQKRVTLTGWRRNSGIEQRAFRRYAWT